MRTQLLLRGLRRPFVLCIFALSLLLVSAHPLASPCAPVSVVGAPLLTCPGRGHGQHPDEEHRDLPANAFLSSGQHYAPVMAAASSQPQANTSDAKKSKWPTDTFRLKTRRGTWMNLSVSPDGKQLVFGMLGDLYILSIKGGDAKRLTTGRAYDTQPKWSPNGKWILFNSDRDGNQNSWVIRPNGKDARQLTHSKWRETSHPIWRPDGQYFVQRQRITDRRSVGVVELWMFHTLGGKGFQLTKGSRIGDTNDPQFSPDGRYIYFAARGRHRYNRNVHRGIWNVMRLDIRTKKWRMLSRNASCPTPSPNGKWVALVRRIAKKTAIVLHELATGRERILLDHLDQDDQEGFGTDGTYPSMSWMPNSKELVYTAKGRFWRVSIKRGASKEIPFVASIEQKIQRALRFVRRIGQPKFPVKMLRWTRLSPKGDRVIFGALGGIWTTNWPKPKAPRKLKLGHKALAYAPVFSADGKRIAYVTWSDKGRGHVWVRDFHKDGSLGAAIRVTAYDGYYASPSFSQDGSRLAFSRASGAEARGLSPSWQPWQEIVHVSLKGKLPTRQMKVVVMLKNHGVLSHIPHPQFSADGQRIFFPRIRYRKYKRDTILCSRRLDGTDELQYVSIYAGEDLQVSPNGQWLLFKHLHQIYLALIPPARKKALHLRINDNRFGGSQLPIVHLSKAQDGGNWPGWSTNKRMVWGLGRTLYVMSFDEAQKALIKQRNKRTWSPKKAAKAKKKKKKGAKQSKRSKRSKGTKKKKGKKKPKPWPMISSDLPLVVSQPAPKGVLALKHVRVVSMKGDEVIEDGIILIKGARIWKVGKASKLKIPKGARIVDLKGKTAIPGMIDVHAHMHYTALDIHPQKNWSYLVNLAYGVTTVHDPSAGTEFVFSQAERVRAGLLLGPRVFSTGFILYGAENTHKAVIRNKQDAIHNVRRLKRQGAWSVKSYMQPTRRQRQWVMEAARQEKVLVYPEGGGKLNLNMSMILDGHTGIEHALPYAKLYDDIIKFFAFSQTGYTPTFLVCYGGVAGEAYFHHKYPAWNDPRLKRFVPYRILNSITRRRSTVVLDNDWHFKKVAKGARDIIRSGGHVQIGSHGQLQGLGYHWEMWSLHSGGLTPLEVLRAATLHGARYLGLEKDLGSIEPGKLADIAILDKNPLKKMHHSTTVSLVVKHGALYNAQTMTLHK